MQNSNCDKIKTEKSHTALLHIGISTAVPYNFHGSISSSWIRTKDEKIAGPQYLGILAVGWCYVLSARLTEIYGDGAAMQYKNDTSQNTQGQQPEDVQSHVIDIGEADEEVACWWSALLTQYEGWEGVMQRTSSHTFLTPWTISRDCKTNLSLKRGTLSLSSSHHAPLSSDRALQALMEFSRLHGLGSQFSIALAMAITFPAHRFYGSTVQLPPPCSTGGKKSDAPIKIISSEWGNLYNDLPYYITLSCGPEVLMSTLCGSFWEPEVPCNLVSPWLHPVLNEVLDGASPNKSHGQEILALIGAIRRPNLSALWIGAIASGLGPIITRKVSRGRPPLDPLAHPWTGSAQSFMDIAGSGPYTCEKPGYISRTDVWRLLHLPSIEEDDSCFAYRPSTPWAPCGTSLTTNCALRVTAHLNCPRHEYHYDHLTWELVEGEIIHDYGFLRTSLEQISPMFEDIKIFEKREIDETASREASLDIFRWLSINGEGLPSESIYENDWLQEIWEESSMDGNEIDEPHTPSWGNKEQDRIESWLTRID